MYIVLGVFYLSHFYSLTHSQRCLPTGDDECSCIWTDSKKIVTLRGIDSTTSQAFKNVPQKDTDYFFDYNPCTPFNLGNIHDKTAEHCLDAYACQHTQGKNPELYYTTGKQKTFSTGMNGQHIVFKYSDGTTGDQKKTTEITLICDENAETPVMSNPVEKTKDNYIFTLTTKCACPDGCAGSSSSGGLSTGSALVIIFFVLIFVYLISGFLILKFYMKKEGTEVIPHYEFWKDFPAKVKDGCVYTKDHILKGWKGKSEYQEI